MGGDEVGRVGLPGVLNEAVGNCPCYSLSHRGSFMDLLGAGGDVSTLPF